MSTIADRDEPGVTHALQVAKVARRTQTEFSAVALDYFTAHTIDPDVAAARGVGENPPGTLTYPNGRRRPLDGNRTLQPKGEPLKSWWLVEPEYESVAIACEGESDPLAVVTHLPNTPEVAGLRGYGVVSLPGATFPPRRLVADLSEKGITAVYLAFDADDAGHKATARNAEALEAAGIRVMVLPIPAGLDLSDALAEVSDPAAELEALIADARPAAGARVGPVTPRTSASVNGDGPAPIEPERSSWAPSDVAAQLAGGVCSPVPSLLTRTDGVALFTREKMALLAAEPESCKSLLGGAAIRETVRRGDLAVVVDFEGDLATWIERLRALDLQDDELTRGLVYIRPDGPLDAQAWGDFSAVLERGPAYVLFDGLEEWYLLEGLDPNDNADTAALYKHARAAARAGAAVAMNDHVTKDKDARGRWARGAGHKIGGVDHAYALEVVEPFGRGRDGVVRVKITKDRGGHVQAHAGEGRLIALVRLHSDSETGRITIDLEPPDDRPAVFRPTVLMRRISGAVVAEPGLSTAAIERGVKGKTPAKREALRLLIAEGFVRAERDGQARRHYSVRPFSEEA